MKRKARPRKFQKHSGTGRDRNPRVAGERRLDEASSLDLFARDPERCVNDPEGRKILRSFEHLSRLLEVPRVFRRMKDENSKKKRKLSGIRLEAPEFKTQEEEEDYKKQLACWRLPLWKQIHMAIHNVKPANFPGCHFPNRVADKLTDYITGYTLVRDLLPPMPERVKKFFRRMAKKTSPGKAKPRQRRETLKTRVKVLMNKELEHNGYEAVYASAIISTIFQEVVGEKTSPSTIGRTVRRSQQKGTQRAS